MLNEALPEWRFVVLLPAKLVRAAQQRLTAFLLEWLPDYSFRVGADVAGLSGPDGFYIVPMSDNSGVGYYKREESADKIPPVAVLGQVRHAVAEFLRLLDGNGEQIELS